MEQSWGEMASAESWHGCPYEGADAAGDLDDLIFFGQEWNSSER